MSILNDPRAELTYTLVHTLELAAAAGFRRLRRATRARRRSYYKRQPGAESPMWSGCVVLLRKELQGRGAKTRLARYLGIPRQRIHNYVKRPTRLPDAEIALQIVHWLAQRAMGKDPDL